MTVGLTGGIASGKSTVASFFRELGCVVYDADQIVRDLYRPGAAGHLALEKHYGRAIFDERGEVDRPTLAQVALSSPEGAAALNALIHPLVIEEQTRLIEGAVKADPSAIVVIEATLLLESGGRERFDSIVVVTLSPELQRSRAFARGVSPEDFERRARNQMTSEARLAHADYVIENNGSLTELRDRTEAVYHQIRVR